MPTYSSISKVPTPTMSDVLNVNRAIGDMAAHIDKLCVPVFASITERNAKIPVPQHGMMCYVESTQEMYVFKRTPLNTWMSAAARNYWKISDSNYSTTLTADPDLKFLAESSSKYLVNVELYISGNTTVDGDMRWTGPVSYTARSIMHVCNSVNATSVSNGIVNAQAITHLTFTGLGTLTGNATTFSGQSLITTSVASGTIGLTFRARNSGTFTVHDGSHIAVWKVG